MRINLLKVINKIFYAGLIIAIPSSGLCEAAEDFPFHMGKTAEKEMTIDYSFDDVWEATLTILKGIDDVTTREMREKGIESFKSNIKDDKNSGLIIYTTTHKGERGFFTARVLPTFTYKVFFIEALKKMRTRIYFHEINYISYDGVIFSDNIFAPHLYFVPSEEKILEEIQDRLKARTYGSN